MPSIKFESDFHSKGKEIFTYSSEEYSSFSKEVNENLDDISISEKSIDELPGNLKLLQEIIGILDDVSPEIKSILNETAEGRQTTRSLKLVDQTIETRKALQNSPLAKFIKILLVKKYLFSGWTEKAKYYFIKRAQILFTWNWVFISYTNKGAGALNKKYERFFEYRDHKYSNAKIVNQIAHYKFHWLNGKDGLRARLFFDKECMKSNEKIEKVLEECRKSVCFIQILHNESFLPPDDPNWCLREYSCFRSTRDELYDEFKDLKEIDTLLYFFIDREKLEDYDENGYIHDYVEIKEWYKTIESLNWNDYWYRVSDPYFQKVSETSKGDFNLRLQIKKEIEDQEKSINEVYKGIKHIRSEYRKILLGNTY